MTLGREAHALQRALPEQLVSAEAEAIIPTRHGTFRFIVFQDTWDQAKQHVAVVAGDVRGADALVRIHSECMTSEVFGSLKCDCREQLERALQSIGQQGCGAVLYMRQEGRGIGLVNKIRAYALQSTGVDTVDANRALGLPDDARRYDAAAAMLEQLGIRSVRLMTNNPAKIDGLRALGVSVTERVPIVVSSHSLSHRYLETKRDRMAHLLELVAH